MFLKVPEGFQRKKISSCADTLLLPSQSIHGTEETFLCVVCGNRGSGETVTAPAAASNIITL